jgi:predicted amidohydrolase
MPSRTFAVAGLQLELPNADNLEVLEQEIRLVRTRFPWLDMVVLGELSVFGPNTAHAQPCPGPAEERFCQIARDTGLWLLPGSMFERRGDSIFNTAAVIDPRGQVVARYRKMFPFRPYERGVTSGDEFVVFDVPDVGRFGVSICYDSWFPETTRTLAWLGAEVILHPTMTNTIDRDVEVAIARASAATNQCYFIDVNVAGRLGVGHSCICGPGGELIHEAGSGREIIPVELDLEYVRRCRERGWHGLGQVLKSFRDSELEFPPYVKGHAASPTLAALGELRLPQRSRPATESEGEQS